MAHQEVHEGAHAQRHEAQLWIEQVVGPGAAAEGLEQFEQPPLTQVFFDHESIGLEDARAMAGQGG